MLFTRNLLGIMSWTNLNGRTLVHKHFFLRLFHTEKKKNAFTSSASYKMKIQQLKTYFICPSHNEKYKERQHHMDSLLKKIGFQTFIHHQSGTENYPRCLSEAIIQILKANLNNEPVLILEDDVEFTGKDDVYFDSETDAV